MFSREFPGKFNPDQAIRNKMVGWDRFEAAQNPQMNTNKHR
jgi:hypothetical protein